MNQEIGMFKKLEFEDEARQGGEEQGRPEEPGPDVEEVKTICRAEDGGWTCRHAPELEGLRCMGIYLRKAGYRPSCLEDYKEAKKVFSSLRKENKEIKKVTDDMVDLIGFFSEEMKADIIVVIMLICAVDGKISSKEKKWIKALID